MTHKIKLATVCQQIRGVSYTPKDMAEIPTEGYIPILRANNIQEKLVFNELVYVNANKISEIQLLKGGDIVVCASSGSKNLVGKAARFVSSPVDQVSFGAFCKVVRPRNIDASYLSHFFNSSYYRNTISKIAQGASINNIRNEHLDNLDINVPTPSEQKRLAERLDKVQELIAKQKEQIATLDLLIKSRFLDMFGDPISNPKGLPQRNMQEISEEIFAGGDREQDLSKDLCGEYQYPVYSNGETNNGLLGYSKNYRVAKRAITVSARGTIGFLSIREPFFTPVVRLITIIPKKEVNIIYLKYMLRCLKLVSSGTSQGQLTVPDFKRIKIILISKNSQDKFSNFVKSVEQQKEVFSARLSRLETLYKSLMQEYFG